MKYVSGDMIAIGSVEIGIKSGLINNRGNLISTVRIIVFAGVVVGGADNIRLKLAKDNAAIIIPTTKRIIFIESGKDKNKYPKIRGIDENIMPNKNELHKLPIKIVLIESGHVIKRSNVFRIVSHGNITGPMDVVVKKRTIVINPEIKYSFDIFLPIVKAKNKIMGNNIP